MSTSRRTQMAYQLDRRIRPNGAHPKRRAHPQRRAHNAAGTLNTADRGLCIIFKVAWGIPLRRPTSEIHGR
jgi:hypothetical protein